MCRKIRQETGEDQMNTIHKWRRFRYLPLIPLGQEGRIVTGSREHIALSRIAAAEGMVLLKNERKLLPLKRGSKVALFGKASIDYVKGGGGSGNTTVAYVRNLYQAMKEKEREGKVTLFTPLCEFYQENVNRQYASGTWAGKTEEPRIPENLLEQAAMECDTAIISICRFSSESSDRKGEENDGDYYLSPQEQKLVEEVTDRFRHVAVVLNVGGMIDSSWFHKEAKIQSVLLGWQGGMEGASAEADILCGDANPSGKLTDTFASCFDDYPSSCNFNESDDYVCYTDDIFVGYRYFETIPSAKEKVNYPFGFGLSYTTFDIMCTEVSEKEGQIHIEVKVTNTGDTAGKEVVQVYTSPYGCRMDMPKMELRAFEKTKLLAAGECDILELVFPVRDMAAYDEEKAAYVLQKGTYTVLLGNSVRSVEETYRIEVTEEQTVYQAQNRCVPRKLPCRLKADGTYAPVAMGEYEPVYDTSDWPPKMHLNAEHILPNTMDIPADERRVMMDRVLDGKASLEEFIADLTDDEVVTLVGGTPSRGPASTRGFAGLDYLGLPAVMTADGPAGLRLRADRGVKTTAWPVATALASSWNKELLRAVGVAGAREVKENNIGIWLTPAVNIHRSPLCGRNFEYFSEDPLVSGKLAAALVQGIQSQNISACVKHFSVNNKETNRKHSDSRVSERALREIYLKAFETVVKEAGVWCVMTAYNLLNGTYCSERKDLIDGILREEWGYGGLVVSDWDNAAEQYREHLAGNDVRMPYGSPKRLKRAIAEGLIRREDLERNVGRMIKLLMKLE